MKNKGRIYYVKKLQEFTLNCRCFRLLNYITLNEVAKDLDYQPSIVNKFERGLNNNAIVYNWYIEHGYNHNINYIEIWCDKHKKHIVKVKELSENYYQTNDKELADLIHKQKDWVKLK